MFYRWSSQEPASLIVSFPTRYHLLGLAATRHEDLGWMHIFALSYTDDGVTWVDHLDESGAQKVGGQPNYIFAFDSTLINFERSLSAVVSWFTTSHRIRLSHHLF